MYLLVILPFSFVLQTVPDRAPPVVWEDTAGICVALGYSEEEGVSGRGPDPSGGLDV